MHKVVSYTVVMYKVVMHTVVSYTVVIHTVVMHKVVSYTVVMYTASVSNLFAINVQSSNAHSSNVHSSNAHSSRVNSSKVHSDAQSSKVHSSNVRDMRLEPFRDGSGCIARRLPTGHPLLPTHLQFDDMGSSTIKGSSQHAGDNVVKWMAETVTSDKCTASGGSVDGGGEVDGGKGLRCSMLASSAAARGLVECPRRRHTSHCAAVCRHCA